MLNMSVLDYEVLARQKREAMVATGTAAVSRLVLYRREHAVALLPRDNGIVLWTLRYGDEIRPAEPALGKADAKLTRLVGKLIDARTEPWSDDLVSDPVQEELAKLIAGKASKRKPAAKQRDDAPASSGNVVSIMDALKRSLAGDTKR